MISSVSVGLANGLNGFRTVSPGFSCLAKARGLRALIRIIPLIRDSLKIINGEESISTVVGQHIGSGIASNIMSPINRSIIKAHLRARYIRRESSPENSIGGRTWITPMDADKHGRIIKHMVIIYHDADKAGKHLDIHLGHLSFIMRVSGKPVEKLLKFNGGGRLTQASKDALLSHIREEIGNNSRVPQNLDHSLSNSKLQWFKRPEGLVGYGAGETRQIVAEDDVEFYHTSNLKTLHLYAPLLNKNRGMYIYRIYNGETPICIWGNLSIRDQAFADRLHLKMVNANDLPKFLEKTDRATTTRKYDGASTHFRVNEEGTKFYSPRFSKETGHRIEYTWKLPELSDVTSTHQPEGMGEILFWKFTPLGYVTNLLLDIRGIEGVTWKYLTAAEIGGVLNSSKVSPSTIYPDLRVYRIDKWNGENVLGLPFFANRILQSVLCDGNQYMKPVLLVHPAIGRMFRWEGLVAVPPNEGILNGYKIKWWGDTYDWTVESVDLHPSPKGNIAGVIWFKSESGKMFKLGPGQIGDADTNLSIMDNPSSYIGKVAKVSSRHGHEGRAAKLIEWHLDKGTA